MKEPCKDIGIWYSYFKNSRLMYGCPPVTVQLQKIMHYNVPFERHNIVLVIPFNSKERNDMIHPSNIWYDKPELIISCYQYGILQAGDLFPRMTLVRQYPHRFYVCIKGGVSPKIILALSESPPFDKRWRLTLSLPDLSQGYSRQASIFPEVVLLHCFLRTSLSTGILSILHQKKEEVFHFIMKY